MALFKVTRGDVQACARELGIPQVTDEMIELVKERVSQDLGGWREIIKEMVRETIKKEAIRCPLGLVCSPCCAWREVGGCLLPERLPRR